MNDDQFNQLYSILSDIKALLASAPQPTGEVAATGHLDSLVLSEATAQYLAQKKHEVSPQHHTNLTLYLAAFVKVVGTSGWTVADVTPGQVARYRDNLLDAGRSVTTVNHHVTTIGGFLRWAEGMGYAHGNAAAALKLRKTGSARRARKAFSPDQLKLLFGKAFFFRTAELAAHRWLPLIMLYTGARPEEVAQLRGRDLREVDGVPVIDFATIEDGQRRKNEASRRLVPMHSKLVELGLRERECRGVGLLFPTLNAGANGRLAEAPSRWFNDIWLRKENGIEDRKLVLYSLRHTVVTQLKVEHRVEDSLIAQLVGHTDSSMTTGRYGKEYDVHTLASVVEQLTWPL